MSNEITAKFEELKKNIATGDHDQWQILTYRLPNGTLDVDFYPVDDTEAINEEGRKLVLRQVMGRDETLQFAITLEKTMSQPKKKRDKRPGRRMRR